MTPVDFPEAKMRFRPLPGLAESQCRTIHAFVGKVVGGSVDGADVVVTAWRPSPEELAVLNAGKPLFLSFLGGLPPHFPTVDFEAAIHPA
jgi:hypothetical protein